jgi:hypothetical protein
MTPTIKLLAFAEFLGQIFNRASLSCVNHAVVEAVPVLIDFIDKFDY